MKRILVGLTLLAMVIAGGAVAWAQAQPSDPLTARITQLQNAYRQVVVDIEQVEAQLKDLTDQKLRLEGGMLELQRYRDEITPAIPIGELFPTTEDESTTAETE